jgi:hypothetical protein
MGYEMWCWVVTEPDGTEGVIAGMVPKMAFMGPVLLQHHKRELAEQFRPLAERHGHLEDKPVRLAHLVEVEPTVF